MSERVAEDRRDLRPSEDGSFAATPAPTITLGAASLRIDGPESAGADSTGDGPAASTPNAADAIPSLETAKAKVFQETGRFFEQVQKQIEEIGHREEHLTQRLAEFEDDERRFRLWANDTEADLAERTAALAAHEETIAQGTVEFDRRQRELDFAADRLEADRQALDRERDELRQEIQRELDEGRVTLEAERQALTLQQAQVQELGDALQEQFHAQQAQLEQQLQQERDQLWVSLSAEWEEHRRKFEQEKAEFLKERA